MRVQLRSLAGVGLVCGAVVLAGCGSETVAGEAEAVGTGVGQPVFSPCDDIPDEALRTVGVDPATESKDILGAKQPGWEICRWNGPEHILRVFSTVRTMDEVRSNEQNTDFAPLELGGRDAVSYREVADTARETCDIAFASGGGTVLVRINTSLGDSRAEEPCAIALQTATELEPIVPR
ncbi:hypothetical protein ABIC28_004322 [Rhodococcus sp. PvR044]|uniref:DUF3558 domain-containing protein n=1 Tax=Rhodococcus sp. OK270 TaxID=1882814 RepID=UPI000BDD4297|nr:DUF3558 domain-containing protein [Rhodococcus sp. OK270]PTR36718.1 uncharacterized protein DUF3558 [Rhodococcus sp. OK611]SNX93812.1 Protein of unknown function [Rhodococcus sp. OK270]